MNTAVQYVLDKLAIGASALCALHCAALPMALVLFPSLAAMPVADESFHLLMVWFVVPSSSIALLMGCTRHKDLTVISAGVLGLAAMVLTALYGHDVLGEAGEKGATFVAALVLAWAHWRNYSLCRKGHCSH